MSHKPVEFTLPKNAYAKHATASTLLWLPLLYLLALALSEPDCCCQAKLQKELLPLLEE
nr:hypothetical protein [Nostoc sp. DedQUE07]MDZ8131948.1 hypothetical protein [Nostoc sp. DedQUE07]